MEESRTIKATRNIIFSFGYKLVDVVLSFVLRTYFIQSLGVNYLGISGLFSSILTVLSLMELGVGSAIAFCLYRPLAEKNHRKVAALMQLYRRVYTGIGVFVLMIGFSLTPFLQYIINLPENIPDLNIIYWLSVMSTAISYFLAYRRTLLTADQRADICTKVDIIFRLIRCAVLISVLVMTKNYVMYLAVDVTNTFLSNLVITVIVKKRYPYIEKAEIITLEKAEKKTILKYMSSTLFTKFGQTVVNSTDSIIISTFISTSMVGYYSNYSLIYSNLDIVVYLLFSSITASVGNFAVTNTKLQSYKLFNKLSMANYMIVCTISTCFFCLASPFIMLWLGEQYCLKELTVIIITLNFFITANQNCIANFMGAMGALYYHNRYRALLEGIVNIVASILLVKYTSLGISGVFLGTTICFLSGRMWMDARVLFNYWFKIPYFSYLKRYFARFFLFAAICVLMKYLTGRVFLLLGVSIVTWVLCGLICAGSCGLVFWLLWRKTEEFTYFTDVVRRTAGKICRRKV